MKGQYGMQYTFPTPKNTFKRYIDIKKRMVGGIRLNLFMQNNLEVIRAMSGKANYHRPDVIGHFLRKMWNN